VAYLLQVMTVKPAETAIVMKQHGNDMRPVFHLFHANMYITQQ
jgi:hypothetical protein